jgi:aryl-alcohol dehydrogenase-like predicted oxidoreductase
MEGWGWFSLDFFSEINICNLSEKFRMNLSFSKIGFGCYRISKRFDEHYKALYKALTNGITLIDTSSNYSDGESEELVGKVMNELIEEGKLKREDITLVTKAGYLQGQNYRLALKLKEEGRPFSEVVEFDDKLWHCISPDFIEDQLNRQLQRLNQNYIDVYLLHNPEYYLSWTKKNNIDKDDAFEIYYDRIRRAFEFLEKKVNEGKINYYGISSNTFASHSNEYDFTSLEEILNIANSISENNHFKVIQFPFNLFEAGAISMKNQINNTETVLELAYKAGLKVLVNRPLNAVTSKGLVRLAEFKAEPFLEKDFIKQMKLVSLMEDDLINEKIADEDLSDDDLNKVKKLLTFGKLVDENWKFFGSIEHFNDTVSQLFAPRIDFLTNFFDEKIDDENIKDFFGRYIKEVYKLLNFVSNYYKLRADKRSNFINNLINKNLDAKFQDLTLSQKAILLLNSVEGVSCVLVGMRKESYVVDVLKILNETKIDNAKEIIEYVSREIEMVDA